MIPTMIGKRCAWNKGKRMTAAQLASRQGRKRTAAARARMRQAAKRRGFRQAAVELHLARLKKTFLPFETLARMRDAMVPRDDRSAPWMASQPKAAKAHSEAARRRRVLRRAAERRARKEREADATTAFGPAMIGKRAT